VNINDLPLASLNNNVISKNIVSFNNEFKDDKNRDSSIIDI
jgi:hypothetical protein